MSRTVLCFGTFDVLDGAHRMFLGAARALGDRLVVSVARDAQVEQWKGRLPRQDEGTRLDTVLKEPSVDEARLSDAMPGSFAVVAQADPAVIALGYDQDRLERALAEWMTATGRRIPMRRIAHVPE